MPVWPEFSRARALGAGVVLLAVPTFFTVVPGWTQWNGALRGFILVVWLLVAMATVRSAVVRDEAIDALTADQAELARRLRVLGTREILAALLRPGSRDIPDHYSFTLYLYDGEDDRLAAYYPAHRTPGPDPRDFKPGKGATGTAWDYEEVVVVTGTAVANDEYGLTPEQQTIFSPYHSVASAVVWETPSQKIGVLTAIGPEDDGFFDAAGGRDSLQILADVVGVALNRVPERDDLN